MVKTADNRLGWVFQKLVESSGPDTDTAPLVTPTGVLVVRGRLTDVGGGPVSGVQFAVVKAGGSDATRTDAMTDSDGVFYAFLPADSERLLVGELHCDLLREQRHGCDLFELVGPARSERHVRSASGR